MRNGQSIHTINRVLIAAVFIVFCLYSLLKSCVDSKDEFQSEMSDWIVSISGKTVMPGIYYANEYHVSSWDEWVAKQAQSLFPIGRFVDGKEATETEVEDRETYERIMAMQANDENSIDADGNLIGTDDSLATQNIGVIDTSIEKMSDFEYLLGNFYTVDGSTMIRSDELNGKELLSKDMHISKSGDGPKILIYHTHSQEMFADSVQGDASTSIVGIGDYLTDLLNEKYQIETMHHKGVYDLIDGKLDRSKAYDLAKEEIPGILEANPSIEVVIDLHRDGVGEGTHLVTNINGKPTAQIMFFNGLSKTRANGEIDYLANPYIQDNLAFSLQMQVAAYNRYPGFARRIYLRGYRYNMHFAPRCLLVEAGAQTNTVQEMENAMDILAELLNIVLNE